MLYLTIFAPTCSGFSLQWIPGQTPAEGPQSSPWQQLWEDPEQLRPYGVPPAERRAQHWVQEHGKIIFWYFTLQWVQKILPLYFTQHEDQKHAKILPNIFYSALSSETWQDFTHIFYSALSSKTRQDFTHTLYSALSSET